MSRTFGTRTLVGGALLLVSMTRPAWPCSIAYPDMFPSLEWREFAAAPLLFSAAPAPTLRRTDLDPAVEVSLVAEPRPELGELWDPFRGAVEAFRPAAPLSPGLYELDGQTFRIDPAGAPVDRIPTPGPAPTLAIHVYEGGDCGVSSFAITTASGSEAPYVVIARTATREARRLSMTREGGHLTILRLDGIDFTEERICVELQGMALDGTLGDPLDLGCIDPRDRSDPRVTRPGPFGCSAQGGASLLPVALLLLGWALGRRRR